MPELSAASVFAQLTLVDSATRLNVENMFVNEARSRY